MSTNNNQRNPRREFIKTAAFLGGAVTLGLAVSRADASASNEDVDMPISVGLWNGHSLLAPDFHALDGTIPGDAAVKLKLQGFVSSSPQLKAVVLHYPVRGDDGERFVPVTAWAANPISSAGVSMVANPHPTFGVTLSLLGASEHAIRLHPSSNAGCSRYLPGQHQSITVQKLVHGTYVLAFHPNVWWGGLLFRPNEAHPLTRRSLSGEAPVRFDYVVLQVSAA